MLAHLQSVSIMVLLLMPAQCIGRQCSADETKINEDFHSSVQRMYDRTGYPHIAAMCGTKNLHWDVCHNHELANPPNVSQCRKIMNCYSRSEVQGDFTYCGLSYLYLNCNFQGQCSYNRTLSEKERQCICNKTADMPHFQMNVCERNTSNNSSSSSQPHIYTPEDITGVKCFCNSTDRVTYHVRTCLTEGSCSFTQDFNMSEVPCSCVTSQMSKRNPSFGRKKSQQPLHLLKSSEIAVLSNDTEKVYCFCNRTRDVITAREVMDRFYIHLYVLSMHLSAYMNQTSHCAMSVNSCLNTTRAAARKFHKWIRHYLEPNLTRTSSLAEDKKCNVQTSSRLEVYISGIKMYLKPYTYYRGLFSCGSRAEYESYEINFEYLLNRASELMAAAHCINDVYSRRCELADSCRATYSLKKCMNYDSLVHKDVIPDVRTWEGIVSEVKIHVCDFYCLFWFKLLERTGRLSVDC